MYETLDLRPRWRSQNIDFGEEHRHLRSELIEILDQFNIPLRQRRVHSDGDDGKPDIRQPGKGSVGVVCENTFQARRIYQPNSFVTLQASALGKSDPSLLSETDPGMLI